MKAKELAEMLLTDPEREVVVCVEQSNGVYEYQVPTLKRGRVQGRFHFFREGIGVNNWSGQPQDAFLIE